MNVNNKIVVIVDGIGSVDKQKIRKAEITKNKTL